MNTTITISKDTRDKIKEFGKKGETYNQIIARLIDFVSEQQLQKLLMDTSNCITVEEAFNKIKKRQSKR